MVSLGWECPRCGTCYAPCVEKCTSCSSPSGLPKWLLVTDGSAGGCDHVLGPIETAGRRCERCGELIPHPNPPLTLTNVLLQLGASS